MPPTQLCVTYKQTSASNKEISANDDETIVSNKQTIVCDKQTIVSDVVCRKAVLKANDASKQQTLRGHKQGYKEANRPQFLILSARAHRNHKQHKLLKILSAMSDSSITTIKTPSERLFCTSCSSRSIEQLCDGCKRNNEASVHAQSLNHPAFPPKALEMVQVSSLMSTTVVTTMA